MKKLILPLLLVFIILGSVSLTKAQDSERSVTMMNFEGEDVRIWGDDDQACTTIRGKHTECQAIADKCVEDGGCAPQLATLNFMGCEKCDAVAKPCFDSVEADYKQCIKAAVAKYKEENVTPSKTPQSADNEAIPSDANEFAKYLDEIGVGNVESLAEDPPSSEDWGLKDPFGQSNEKLPESKILPGSDTKWSIVSRQDPTEGYKVTIESLHVGPTIIFPSGYEYPTSEGETIIVPVGSKIITDKFNSAYISIQANGPVERFSMYWESEIELRATDSSKVTELKVNQGFVRFNTKTRTRVRLGREDEYTVNTKGTDFAVYFDPQTQQGAVEIYDQEVQVLSPTGREYSINSQYGNKIKRVEWEGSNEASEKTAVPKSIWKKYLAQKTNVAEQEPQPTSVPSTQEEQKSQIPVIPGLIGLLALLSVALFWYRKKTGSLPLEGKVLLIIEKVRSLLKK